MKRSLFILSILFFSINLLIAENKNGTPSIVRRTCGTERPSEQWSQDFQQKVVQFVAQHQNNSQNRINAVYNLPVIVHVVYWNAAENISQAQVYSQFDVLNADYAGTGLNANTCPAPFLPLLSNTNISFCKAAKNPNGVTLLEPGIDRVNAQTLGFTDPGTTGWSKSYITNTIKSATTWDANKYMNIWVLPLGDDLLGYATFPGGSAVLDGVVIGYKYFGNTGVLDPTYNKGRTATHEIGHWLGLYHISGDEACGDDLCNDTPTQKGGNTTPGLNYGCPTFPFQVNGCGAGTSPNGELFMNFMDYVDDPCMYLFTPDQTTRMQTVLTTDPKRIQLSSSTTCNTTPQKPTANFTADRTTVCPGGSVKFTDLSLNNPTSWLWTFAGGTPGSSTSQNPTITYNSAGNYTVTLRATNSLGFDDTVRTAYIVVGNPTGVALPFSEGFQNAIFPPTGWSLNSASTFNWERSTLAGGFGTSNASAYFHNFDIDASNLKDDIITPTINLNGASNPRLKFDVAYTRYSNSSKDTLEVLLQEACSGLITSIYKKGGTTLSTTNTNISSDFVPTAAQWRKDSVFIPANYLNKYVKVIFRNYGAFGNNIYVDNINLYGVNTSTPTPTASFTVSDTTVCSGNNLSFTSTSTASAGSVDSVRWTIPGGIPSTSIATNVTSTFNTPGSYTITLKAYKNGNVSTATKSIRVKALPTVAAISGATSVCVGASTTYASSTTGGVWTSSAPGIANVNSSGLVSGVSAGSAEIIYTVTSSGCSNVSIKVITVNAAPSVAAITGATSVCVGASTTYASSTTGGVWTSSAPGIASVNSSGLVNGVSAGSAEIRYTVSSGGCSTMVTKVITVNALPNVTVTSPSVCAGQTAQPVASGATSYTWTGGLSAIFNPTTPALTTTTTYTVTGTTAGCSKTAVATVTVNVTAPTVTITPNPASVCNGDAITLTGNGANNYTWTSSQTGTSQGASLTFSPTGTITVNLSGTLTGCSTPGTTSVSVTIKGRPTVGASLPSVCVGQTAQPIANGAVSYTWTGGLASISNPVTPPLTATTTYTVTGTAANGCTGTAISTVTVKPTPGTPTITQSHDTLFSNVIISGASYEWYKGGVLQTTTSTPYYKFPSSGIYTLKVISNDCPSAISANFNAILTGIKNNKLNVELSIIPNPNNGSFEIRITSGMNKTYQLKLFNLSGQVLVDEEMNIRTGLNSKRVNLIGIEKGAYFLNIIGEDGTTTQNIIVQ